VLSIVIFREPFYWTTAVGVFLVLAGVVMITARVS
jgi:multidrug transporter EmrE-like cation transporter